MGYFFLGLVIAFAFLTIFIMAYGRRVAQVALTDPFQAAESITNGRLPEKWFTQINRRLALERMLPVLQQEASGAKQAVHKLDRLIHFFERSPFFENAEARELLLTCLQETRQRWINMTWEEISKEYGNVTHLAEEDKKEIQA